MKKLLILGIAAAIACAAYAYPTLKGPSGLVLFPDATVVPAGQLQVAADWWYFESGEDATIPLRVLYGIGDQFEIGAAYTTMESSSQKVIGLNAKYVLPASLGDAAWAVGATYLMPDEGDNLLGLTLSGTKAFAENFSGTATLVWQEDTTDLAFGLGGEATFENDLKLVIEYVNFLPTAGLNMAARYPLTEALTAQLGFEFDTSLPFIGLNYAIGGESDSY